MISGTTTLIAHLGYPTVAFASPLIYNPWFDRHDIDAVVVPMGVRSQTYPAFFRSLFTLTNIRGALVTMPHRVVTCGLVDELSPIAAVAGAVNAVLVREDGSLLGDQFDGAGFVRAMQRKGFDPRGKRALVVGNGGVGSAIAASLAGVGVTALGLYDPHPIASGSLADRIGIWSSSATAPRHRRNCARCRRFPPDDGADRCLVRPGRGRWRPARRGRAGEELTREGQPGSVRPIPADTRAAVCDRPGHQQDGEP